jgi:hypothetical protein
MSLQEALRESLCMRGYAVPRDLEEEARLAEQAKTFPIKRLPYAGEMSCLKFDRRTWRSSRRRVTKEMGDANLSYSDFLNGFHIKQRATAHEMRLRYTPLFASDDEKLKLVIAQQSYNYIRVSIQGISAFYGGESVPNGLVINRPALEKLANRATENWKKRIFNRNEMNRYSHVTSVEANGGYVAMRAAIAYRAWRLAKDSHTIAEEMGVDWRNVRIILYRLCEVARRLGLETFPRHHSCYKDLYKPFDFEDPNPYKVREYRGRQNHLAAHYVEGLSALIADGTITGFEALSFARHYSCIANSCIANSPVTV